MPDDERERVDPRYDPRFQRGYVESASTPGVARVEGAAAPVRSRHQQRDAASTGRTARSDSRDDRAPDATRRASWVDDRASVPDPAVPEDAEFEAGDDVGAWAPRVPALAGSAYRWLVALWWIGGALLALGVVSLAYGIWANNDTAGQSYQDFFITVFSSIAWQLYGPALTIGLATLVATGVLQTLAPGLRERR